MLAVHRKNEVLMNILDKYVDNVIETKKNEEEGFKKLLN